MYWRQKLNQQETEQVFGYKRRKNDFKINRGLGGLEKQVKYIQLEKGPCIQKVNIKKAKITVGESIFNPILIYER